MAANDEREVLIQTLDTTVREGLGFFGRLADTPVRVGVWGPKEVLSHLLFYHQLAIEGMKSIRGGGAPYKMDAHVDQLNARAVAREAGRTIEELIADIQRAHRDLLEEGRLAPDLGAVAVVRWDDTTSTVRHRFTSYNDHWLGHVRDWTEAINELEGRTIE